RPGRAERVDAQILLGDRDFDFLSLRENRNRDGGSMDTPAAFSRRDTLDTVYAAFVFEPAVDTLTFDERDDFLEAADSRRVGRENLDTPSLPLCVSGVHSKDVRHKQSRFVASRPGTNFKDDVSLVVGILGEEQDLQFFTTRIATLLEVREFLFRHGFHVGVLTGFADQSSGFPNTFFQCPVFLIAL